MSLPSPAAHRAPLRLGRHLLAHLKAVAEGVSPIIAARTYLDVDEPSAGIAHQGAVLSAIMVARRAGLGTRWRLLRLTLTLSPTASAGAAPAVQPSVDEWAAESGLEDWPAAELQALYADAFGLGATPTERRKIAQIERLRHARITLLDELAKFTVEAPRLSDAVGGWFPPNLTARLEAAGFLTLGQLREEIALRGKWWRRIPAFGPKKAALLADQLLALLGATPCPSNRALDPSSGLGAPWRLEGVPTPQEMEVIATWIRHRTHSDATARAYRREAERFALWLDLERGHQLLQATADDCAAYIDFLAAVPRDWISRQRAPRASSDWAPFASQPSVVSQRFALTVLEALVTWLSADGHVQRNPWLKVNRRLRDDPNAPPQGLSRAFTVEVWNALIEHTARIPAPAGRRMRWLLGFVQATGLRAQELLRARNADLYEQDDGTWLHVHGKGGRNRSVPVPLAALRATEQYFGERGLRLDAAHGNTPLLAGLARPALPGSDLSLAFTPPSYLVDPSEIERAEHTARCGITYSTLQAAFKRFVAAALGASDLSSSHRAHAARASAHWLRHTHATRAAEADVPIDVLQANLGQADPRTTSIYYRAQQRRRREAMERVFA